MKSYHRLGRRPVPKLHAAVAWLKWHTTSALCGAPPAAVPAHTAALAWLFWRRLAVLTWLSWSTTQTNPILRLDPNLWCRQSSEATFEIQTINCCDVIMIKIMQLNLKSCLNTIILPVQELFHRQHDHFIVFSFLCGWHKYLKKSISIYLCPFQ